MTSTFQTRFPAFKHLNFRRYAMGQVASIGGTWLQMVALTWLVLEITDDSASSVGVVMAAQFLPPLLLGAWAGTVADRFDPRKAVLVLQIFLGTQAMALALLVFSGKETVPTLVLLAAWQGIGAAFDAPVRQTMMNELVGDEELSNAIATNSALVQLGLIVGPAIGAVLIGTIGIAWCFVVNAISYLLMFAAIYSLRTSEMIVRPEIEGTDGSVRAGFGHLRTRKDLRLLLMLLSVAGLIALRIDVLIPLLAKDLGGEEGLYGVINVSRGLGALAASVYFASLSGPPAMPRLKLSALLLAASLAAMAIPNREAVVAAAFLAGLGYMGIIVCTLSMTQLLASPEFRGRLVAVWFVVMSGGMVFGSLLTGQLADVFGPGNTILIGAGTMLAATGIATRWSHLIVIPAHEAAPTIVQTPAKVR